MYIYIYAIKCLYHMNKHTKICGNPNTETTPRTIWLTKDATTTASVSLRNTSWTHVGSHQRHRRNLTTAFQSIFGSVHCLTRQLYHQQDKHESMM